MKKKAKAQTNDLTISQTDVANLQKEYLSELDTNPEYSLEPDPTGELHFDLIQKDFVRHYVNFKNINAAAELSHIDADLAKQYFVSYDVQQEIRRINRALYHRQFSSKLLSIDDMSGYLSSLITGENVPIADQLKTTEKLRVVELLLRLNEMKMNGMSNPSNILHQNLEAQIKNLSVGAIQQLLVQQNNTVVIQQKNEAISAIDDGTLSLEEKAYLSTLPVEELLKLLEETNKGGSD